MNISEILTHLGEDRKKYFNSVAPPIIQTSNFVFDTYEDLKCVFQDEFENSIYTRGNNPTVAILRKKLAALEKAEDALVTSSGIAAVAAAVLANLSAGDHVVCIKSSYGWAYKLFTNYLSRYGVTVTYVDGRSNEAIKSAIQTNTKMLYLESPNSMLMELQDLTACAQIANQNDLVTVIDNSFASPLNQNPIEFGIDLVVHSGTKYINGHSDVVCGVICGSKKMIRKIFESEYMNIGAIIGAQEAALIIRGLRTLEIRLERSQKSTDWIIEKLENHPKVEKVNYPFARDFPQRELAFRQMRGGGGLFSVNFKTESIENIRNFSNALRRFLMAVSWGGYESLIIPIAAFYDQPGQPDPELPWNLVRFYVGLEDPEWLWEDLEKAMEQL